MGLNIVARRRVDLKDFAEGWSGCFITVKVASEAVRTEYTSSVVALQTRLRDALELEEAEQDKIADEVNKSIEVITRELAAKLIVGGRVISTAEDGNESPVEFATDPEDISAILEAFNYSWVSHIIDIAVGLDRLKAANSKK